MNKRGEIHESREASLRCPRIGADNYTVEDDLFCLPAAEVESGGVVKALSVNKTLICVAEVKFLISGLYWAERRLGRVLRLEERELFNSQVDSVKKLAIPLPS